MNRKNISMAAGVILLAGICMTGCASGAKEENSPTQVSVETIPETAEESPAAIPAGPETGQSSSGEETSAEAGDTEENGEEDIPADPENASEKTGEDTQVTVSDPVSVGGYTYHVETLAKSWLADTGQVACHVELSGPVFEGGSEAEDAINVFYEEWRSDMLAGYEDNPESIVKYALDIKNDPEFADAAGSEEIFTLESVVVREKVISVYQSFYTYEGGAHGMPGRENHLFDRATGKETTLEALTGLSTEEINEKMRGMFLQLVNEDTENAFFPDAADTLAEKNNFTQNYYLSDEGVVFYMQPYEIAPYAAGYTEITIPFEEFGIG